MATAGGLGEVSVEEIARPVRFVGGALLDRGLAASGLAVEIGALSSEMRAALAPAASRPSSPLSLDRGKLPHIGTRFRLHSFAL
jgi:hypothetical protein